MHSRNLYRKNPANFAELGKQYEKFRKHLIPTKSGGYTINFKDPRALKELTASLLDKDFGLKIELPLERLIPTIPQKLNYIHWIEDLLAMLKKVDREEATRGIDIGTGASCVYPLLGAKINGWKFIASEVDEVSFRYACENVKRNNFAGDIHVQLVDADSVVKALLRDNEDYDFCMCNPPFFSNEAEKTGTHSRTGTRPQPNSVSTGTVTETVTSGGEVGFVSRIIEDSLELGTRVRWYTTMLGKKSSVAAVVSKLKENDIRNILTTEFCQGRTMRWGVAWTFLPDVVAEPEGPPKKKRKVKPLELSLPPEKFLGAEAVASCRVAGLERLISNVSEIFRNILSEFEVSILSECTVNTAENTKMTFNCRAKNNTWANQRRKRREAARKFGTRQDLENEAGERSKNGHLNKADNLPAGENSGEELLTERPMKVGKAITSSDYNTDCFDSNTENAETKKDFLNVGEKFESSETPVSLANEKDVDNSSDISDISQSTSNDYFIEFILEVGVKLAEVIPGTLPNVFFRMAWVRGKDRNSMYQLFQYFQNRFGR